MSDSRRKQLRPTQLDVHDDEKPVNASSGNMTYLQRHVQQVVDHLTLCIPDVDFAIESTDDAECKVVLEAKGLNLLSFGRKEVSNEAPLSQRISLNSFRAYIMEDETETLPLIDSIGYAASVRRVSGRRFFDGLTKGLEIVGEANAENSGLFCMLERHSCGLLPEMWWLYLRTQRCHLTQAAR